MSEPLGGPAGAADRDEDAASRGYGRTVGIGLAVLALLALGSQAGPYLERFRDYVAGLGPLGPLVFIVGYIVATVFGLPGAILTLAAGSIFGVAWGSVYVFIGATLGAAGAFLAARHVIRSSIEARVAGNPRFAAIDRAIAGDGRRIVLLLRLSPVFPFNLLNYALGLTRIGFVDYFVASVGMIPGTVLYVYLGALGGEAALAASGGAETELLTWAIRILGFAATLLVTVIVTRTARRALDEAAIGEEPSE
ncbi:MAG: TVP38/TMEM64 family protein [Myxococcales bacterium]|nr:TVP38/TMEM64 family protein [Myxococcales bacterium]